VWDSGLLNGFLAFLAPRAEQAIAKRDAVSKSDAKLAGQWQNEFQALIEAVKSDQGEIYLLAPSTDRDLREYRQEYEFAGAIKAASAGLKFKSAAPIFAELRQVKSTWEQKLLQHAVDITAEAFHRVFAAAAPAMHEYEIQAEFEYTFRRRGADNWGYPCIVGAGPNATTLHYITNQDRLDDGSLAPPNSIITPPTSRAPSRSTANLPRNRPRFTTSSSKRRPRRSNSPAPAISC
jgi:Xaa-Pro aminopeptidase